MTARILRSLSKRESGMILALEAIKALSHPLRLSILCSLIENDEMMAGDIVVKEAERASQSQVSQYLSTMKAQGLITDRRNGHNIYYRLADKRIAQLIATLHQLYCR